MQIDHARFALSSANSRAALVARCAAHFGQGQCDDGLLLLKIIGPVQHTHKKNIWQNVWHLERSMSNLIKRENIVKVSINYS